VSVCGFILIGGIERFVVLVGVEEMAELDDDLRQQLKDAEADIHNLKAQLAKVPTSRHCSHQCSHCAG
jgi:hypothetical protein